MALTPVSNQNLLAITEHDNSEDGSSGSGGETGAHDEGRPAALPARDVPQIVNPDVLALLSKRAATLGPASRDGANAGSQPKTTDSSGSQATPGPASSTRPSDEPPAATSSSKGTVDAKPVADTVDGMKPDRVTVFRVEGAGNQRLVVGIDGSVDVPKVLARNGSERNLYLNFGNEARARTFLAQRLKQFPDNAIKTFEVPSSFLNELKANAVPENERAKFPERPVIADPTKATDQFGLSEKQIQQLRGVIIQGSGKVMGPEKEPPRSSGEPLDDKPPSARPGPGETVSGTKEGTPPSSERAPSSSTESAKAGNVGDPATRSFSLKEGTIAGAAVGATVTAAQLALTGKLDVEHAAELAKGAGEGAVIGAVATKAEQLVTPLIDRAIGGAVQKGATQLASTLAGEGAADTAGVVARTLATRAAGGTVVGAAITAGISAWDNREGLAHGDSHAVGNVVADTTVAAGSIVAATAAGAAVGSVVPVAGTAVGAAVGLAVGVGITYGAQISGVRDDIANGVAHGVDEVKDAAKSVGNAISDVASKFHL